MGNLRRSTRPHLEKGVAGNSPYVFARLKDGRYYLRFGEEHDIMKYKGLGLIEYLLKQPNTPAPVLEIDRALSDANPTARPGDWRELVGEEDNGLSPDAHVNPDPADEELVEATKDKLEERREWLAQAKQLGQADRAAELEREGRALEQWLREQERLRGQRERGQCSDGSSVETVRKRWAGNLNTVYEKMKGAGLTRLVAFLEEHIQPASYSYTCIPDPGVTWSFTRPES